MTLVPIIERELRASARHAFTYYLRAAGVTVALVVSLWFGLMHGFGSTMGGRLFRSLHSTLFCAIWVLVPIMTADCISRERREGTLGLLFMTPLTGADVVIAKGFAHGLRALSLLLAVLPVLTIPFLIGGVSGVEAIMSALIDLGAMCWALSAGLLASASSRVRMRALITAALCAIFFFFLVELLVGWRLSLAVSVAPSVMWPSESSLAFLLGLGFETSAMGAGVVPGFAKVISTAQMLRAMVEVSGLSFFALVLVLLIAGRKTRLAWQDESPSAWKLWLNKVFCTPVIWLSLLKRWMRHKIERNPIGWLEQRTWSGRLVTWGWLAVIIALYSAILGDRNFFNSYRAMQLWLAWLMCGSLAMSAAGSFRRERESGVLELLLVSPLHEEQIILGRLAGLWGQFLPSFALLLSVWTYFQSFTPQVGDSNEPIFFFGLTYFTLPVVGLYFSLYCRALLSAFLATIVVGLLLPMILPLLLARFTSPNFLRLGFHWSGQQVIIQLLVAGVCWLLLDDMLRRRSFPWEKMEAR